MELLKIKPEIRITQSITIPNKAIIKQGNNLYIQTPRLNCATLVQSDNRCAMDLVFDKSHGKF